MEKELLDMIAAQLDSIEESELSQAENNIVDILCRHGYMERSNGTVNRKHKGS